MARHSLWREALVSVEVKQDNVDVLIKAVEALTLREVLVGIPEDKADRPGGDVSNALLGYVHEFGSPARNIPARPFLMPAVRDDQERIARLLGAGARKAASGEKGAGEQALNAVGLVVSTDAKKKITGGIPPPLRPATLAARRRRSFTGTTPLIVTGSLLRSITYVVRLKTEG
jgi:hypothetical protein